MPRFIDLDGARFDGLPQLRTITYPSWRLIDVRSPLERFVKQPPTRRPKVTNDIVTVNERRAREQLPPLADDDIPAFLLRTSR